MRLFKHRIFIVKISICACGHQASRCYLITLYFFQGDEDDFAALKRTVDKIIASRQLASKVAIHNLCNLTGKKSQPLVYVMWPTPNSGYCGSHLLKIWRKVRQDCAANNFSLIGHSVDSAGFSLSASVQLMTPTESAVANGINYLGFGVPDEKNPNPKGSLNRNYDLKTLEKIP